MIYSEKLRIGDNMFPRYELRNSAIYVALQKKITKYPTRFHKQVELLWVKKNKLKVTIDSKEYTLNEGDIYLVFPNILHSIECNGSEALLIVADDDFFISYHDLLSHFKPENPVMRKGKFPEIVYTLLDRIAEIQKMDFEQKGSAISGYITAIIGEMLESINLLERSADSDLIQLLVLYLLDNYTKEITLEDVARDLNYNKFYVSHIISDTFKCNFRVLINSYRIGMAQNLLLSTDKNISEIAYECGFKNQSSFNRIFLKHCGMTPSVYRHTPEDIPDKPTVYEKKIDNTTKESYNLYIRKVVMKRSTRENGEE